MPLDLNKPFFLHETKDRKGFVSILPGGGSEGGDHLGLGSADNPYEGIQFWCGIHPSTAEACCFWHLVKPPEKNGISYPLFDYQQDIFNKLEGINGQDVHKYMWIKKSRGIGITEFFTRYLAWLGVGKNHMYKGSQFCIVCGPRQNTAIKLIKRIKKVLRPLEVLEETERTTAKFLDVTIEAFPSHHLDTMRGDVDVPVIYIDEADFFPISEQTEVRRVAEGYIGKTNPAIIFVSTPNNPGGLYEQMEFDRTPNFFYHRIYLPYTIGLGKIYNEKEIEQAKLSPSFEREYNLQYGYGTGNLFLEHQLEAAIAPEGYEPPDWHVMEETIISLGIDPGHAFSKFAYVISGLIDGKVHILETEEFDKAGMGNMIEKMAEILDKFNIMNVGEDKVFVDGSQVSFIRDLKYVVGERQDYEIVRKEATLHKIEDLGYVMKIIPIAFNKDGHKMVDNLQSLVAKNALIIPRHFDKLIMQLRIAKEINGRLDKNQNSLDSVDALMMSLLNFQW